MRRVWWWYVSVFAAFAGCCFSEPLRLPTIFSDHMVLQREQAVPVWGTAEPGATITVEFGGQTKTTVADVSKHWKILLDPMPASSKPRKMTISSSNNSVVQYSDLLVGDVWLCSGQSNMAYPLVRSENGKAEISKADYPLIRLFKSEMTIMNVPQDTIDGEWAACTPESVTKFSAVGYYFGRKLFRDLKIPIGLLSCAYPGTPIEAWTPPCGFESVDSLKDIGKQIEQIRSLPNSKENQRKPTCLYNSMVHAHIPYAIRGVIWYQGEANHADGMLYVDKTRALLNGWRSLWGTDFPFYFVQIAPFRYGKEDPEVLARFWQAQASIVDEIPNTGMVVISDAATPGDIHPTNKEIPGTRLALLAEAREYGMDVVGSGPVFQGLEKQRRSLKVLFDSAERLTTRDGKSPDWFEVAGEDGVFKQATAEICEESVVVSSDEVLKPVAVRFAWNKLAMPNLVNGAGLPASAFMVHE